MFERRAARSKGRVKEGGQSKTASRQQSHWEWKDISNYRLLQIMASCLPECAENHARSAPVRRCNWTWGTEPTLCTPQGGR